MTEPGGDDVERLRFPGERPAFLVSVASNFVVIAAAVAIVIAGTDWLEDHPFVARHIEAIRAVLIAAILSLPTTILARRISFVATRGNGVRVDPSQFPELYARFVEACRKLGVQRMPELYLSRDVGDRVAVARAGGSAIVVNAEFVDDDWKDGLDWLTFAVAGALGDIRLGHTRWWVEFLTVYSRSIPGVRTPLLLKWAHSRDRCGAFVVPDGIRGLIVEAVGNHALPAVDVPAFVEQTRHAVSTRAWDRLAAIWRGAPLIVDRAHVLYRDGFFTEADSDRARTGPTRP